MATLDEVAAFVATACSLTVASTLFKGTLPATPDACGAVYEYGGLPPRHIFGATPIAEESPRLQLAFRGAKNDYATPRALAETAYRALAAASAQSLSGTRYLTFEPLQPPFLLRRDENSRPIIGFSVQVTKELSVT
jgi:hypothetical protein